MSKLSARSIVRPGMAAMGAVFVSLVMSAGAWGQCMSLSEVQSFTADLFGSGEAFPGQEFGFAVAMDGDTLVVGAPRDNQLGSNAGAAYVLSRQPNGDWIKNQKILEPGGGPSRQFGNAVAVNGDLMVIGAWVANAGHGTAHVFQRTGSTWNHVQALAPSGVTSGHLVGSFGTAVAISDGFVIVGAPKQGPVFVPIGAVHVFAQTSGTWVQTQKISPWGPATTMHFGKSLSVSGSALLIGAPWDTEMGSSAGAAFVLRRTGTVWQPEQKLVAPDGYHLDEFGDAVDVSGDIAVIGAPEANIGNATGNGAAYIFRDQGSGQWDLEEKLTAYPQSVPGERFGYGVFALGNSVVIGARQGSGTAYAFRKVEGMWLFEDSVTGSEAAPGHRFSFTIAGDGEDFVIGAYGGGVPSVTHPGTIYSFTGVANSCSPPDPDFPDCAADLNGDGVVNVHDLTTLLGEWGPCHGICPADLIGNGEVGVLDVLELLGQWGDCS